jgi:hypothetical protein
LKNPKAKTPEQLVARYARLKPLTFGSAPLHLTAALKVLRSKFNQPFGLTKTKREYTPKKEGFTAVDRGLYSSIGTH